MTATPKNAIELVHALASIKKASPALFERLYRGLAVYCTPAYQGLLYGQPDRLQTAQGRAQAVDELMKLVETCSEQSERLHLEEAKRGTNAA